MSSQTQQVSLPPHVAAVQVVQLIIQQPNESSMTCTQRPQRVNPDMHMML